MPRDIAVVRALREIAEALMQKLFFHIGHGKTGSSYLQSCLALSAGALRAQGIHYPLSGNDAEKALAGHVSMGNFPPPKGYQHHLAGTFEAVYAEACAAATGETDKLLLSNEALFTSISRFDFLDEVRRVAPDAQCEFLLFIRNPLDHALSAFQQNLKGNKVSTPEETLNKYSIPKHVKIVIDAIASKGWSITILNYSNHRKTLMDALAGWLDVSRDLFTEPPARSVNRSLTRTEMELQRAFNRHVGQRARLFVADALSNELPDILPEQPYVEPDALAAFLERMDRMISQTNALIPESEQYRLPSLEEAHARLPEQSEKDRFVLNAEQIDVLARNMARFFRQPHNKKKA